MSVEDIAKAAASLVNVTKMVRDAESDIESRIVEVKRSFREGPMGKDERVAFESEISALVGERNALRQSKALISDLAQTTVTPPTINAGVGVHSEN